MSITCLYSITDFLDETRELVARGLVARQQRIYELRRYFSESRWQDIEHLLNQYDYRLKDYIIDLVGKESWTND
ncbi:MAG: DUF4327 family protein [Thermosynechococcaceae cyanobacterium]